MAFGEVGSLTRGGFGDGEVVRINFTEPLGNAVIHLSSTNAGGNEFSLRVVSVDANGFSFILEEWEDEDGPHPASETINWIAVEPGVHTLPDGRIVEAGTTTATTTASSVSLNGGFTGAPVILTNVMSQNDPDVVDSDPLNVTSSGFDVQLQEGSLSDGVNTGESVGWIAIQPGGNGTSGYASIAGNVNSATGTYALGGSLSNGAVFGETQTVNDPDAGNIVINNGASITGSSGSVSARFDEETGDGESTHPNETLGLVGFEKGLLLCFTPGTRIATPFGPREITTLQTGDLVLTQDDGPQPLRYIHRSSIDAARLACEPDLRPIRIAAGSLGPGLPERDLIVSPQHRMCLGGWRAELLFGQPEILVPAKGMINDCSICVDHRASQVEYIHLAFDRHQIVFAEGAPSESLYAGAICKSAMDAAAREELFRIFPDLRTAPESWGPVARPALNVRESRLMALQ